MLAYELYLANKDFEGEFFKSARPIKKCFVKKSNGKFKVNFDDTTIDEFGGSLIPNQQMLQKAWDMPTNSHSGIPYRVTGSNSPKPYIRFYGKIDNKKIEISYGILKASVYRDENYRKPAIEANDKIKVNLDKESYFIGDESLFEVYVKNGLVEEIKGKTFVSSELFKEVTEAFFRKYKNKRIEDVKKGNFVIYVLPKKGDIEYRKEEAETTDKSVFPDAFGNDCTAYSSGTTRTAKFLTFDDPAYTLNNKQKEYFYEEMGVGDKSLEKVEFPTRETNIAGLTFYFLDLDNPNHQTEYRGLGFYRHIYDNYVALKGKRNKKIQSHKGSRLKITGVKVNNAQKEILIDANLTLAQMENILKPEKFGENIPPHTFEVFIKKSREDTYWRDYIWAINNYLIGNKIDKKKLERIFVHKINEKLFEFLKKKNRRDAKEFVNKTYFCMKLMCGEDMEMENDENMAYAIGKIAGKYVGFKEKEGQSTSSLSDILTYSKYNENKLRHVYQKVCLGISLYKGDDGKKKDMEKFVKESSKNMPVKLKNPDNDYSYFFYRGVFEELI